MRGAKYGMTNFHQSGHQFELLREEHAAVLDKLTLLTQAILAPQTARDAALPRYRALLLALLNDLDRFVNDHFRLEEHYLFPVLRQAGKRGLADSLALEQVAIRHAALPVLGHVRNGLAANPGEDDWKEFGRQAAALIEMKRAHVRRVQIQVVPVLRALTANVTPQFPRPLPQAAL